MIWRDREVAIHTGRRRKTMHIVVERDGSLSVQVPAGLEERKILEVLERRAYSIFRMLQRWRESHSESSSVRIASGQAFLLKGRTYTLRIVKGLDQDVKIQNCELMMRADLETPFGALRKFYVKAAKELIPRRLAIIASRLGVNPANVRIRDMKTRWGSCTPRGVVTYNWRAVMAPVRVVDYIITHELVHLKYHRHSREFWAEMGLILPDYSKSIEWLRRNGVRMELNRFVGNL